MTPPGKRLWVAAFILCQCVASPLPGKVTVDLADLKFRDSSLRRLADKELALGIFAPFSQVDPSFLAAAVAFAIDVEKNWNASIASRLGAPVIPITNVDPDLRVKVQIANSLRVVDMILGNAGFSNVVGLIGSYDNAIGMSVGSIAGAMKIPQMSFSSVSATDTSVGMYPYLSRTKPSETSQGKALWKFVEYLEIPLIACVYSEGTFAETVYRGVRSAASDAGMAYRIAGVAIEDMPNIYDIEKAQSAISRIRALETKFVFLAMDAAQGRQFFAVAATEGLLTTDWQLIGCGALSLSSLGNGVSTPLGYLYLSYETEGSKFAEFESLWTQLTIDDMNTTDYALDILRQAGNAQFPTAQTFNNGAASMASEVPLLFDAAYAFVIAANNLLNSGTNIADVSEQRLMDALRSVTFEGVSGTVAFDQFGDRLCVHILQNVKMVGGTKDAEVSMKYNAVGGSVAEVVQVMWQDGSSSSVVPAQLAACPAGTYKNSSTLMCDQCPMGRVSAGGVGLTTCDSCPLGKYQDQSGQSECFFREIVLGVYAPITSISMSYWPAAATFDLDFRKNFNSSLVDRFGNPIVQIPNLHPNLRFKVQIGDSNSSLDTGIGLAVDMVQGRNGRSKSTVLIGGCHSSLCEPITQLAATFEVPQIAWGCTSPILSNKAKYPLLARTIPSDAIQGQAYWEWLSFFQIPSVVLMYVQDAYGEGLYAVVRDLAAAAGEAYRVNGVSIPHMQDGSLDQEVTKNAIQLAKGMNTRFIQLVMAGNQGRTFFPIAQQQGLLGTDWQFLASEGLPFAMFPDLPIGYMWLSPVSRGPLFSQFADMWRSMTVDDIAGADARLRYGVDDLIFPPNGGVHSPPTNDLFAMTDALQLEQLIFDACYAVAVAANQLMNDGMDPEQMAGQLLLDAVKASQFEGVTGLVSFDANGDRLASFNLNNVQPDGNGGKIAKVAGLYESGTASFSLTGTGVYWQSGTLSDSIPQSWMSCAAGMYRNNKTRMCDPCPKDTFSEGGEGVQCQSCAIGRFQDEVGQSECKLYEIVIGIYGPLSTVSMSFLASAVAFDLDFRKNYNQTLVERFGPPVIPFPNFNPNLRIKVQIGNSNSQPDVGVAMALDMFQGTNGYDKIQGLIGGLHSGICMPVNNLAIMFDIPQLSWACSSPKLSNKDEYKFFVRTIPPDSLQGQGMWEFVKVMKIPSAAFFYAKEPYGEGLFSTINNAAANDGMSFKISGVGMTYMPANYDYSEAEAKVQVAKSQGTKFIFVAMSQDQARKMWSVALREDVGFGTRGVQFIGSEALGFAALGDAVPAGYIFFGPVSRGDLFSKYEEMWKKMTPQDVVGPAAREYYRLNAWRPPLEQSTRPLPSTEMFEDIENRLQLEDPFLFDAAYTYAFAMNEMMNEGVPPAKIGGEALLNKIRKQTFQGISGTVDFDVNGDRFAAYTISNVVPGTDRRLSGGLANATLIAVIAAIFDSKKVGTDEPSISWVVNEGILWQDGTQGKNIPATFTACAPGYSAVAVGETCIKCHAGSYSLGGAMPCQDCPPGRMTNTGEELGATGCVDCTTGTVAKLPGSTFCEDCPRGTIPNGSSTVCMRCPQGFYQDQVAGTECKECGPAQTTQFQGAEQFEDCKCLEGYFDKRIDFSTNSSCSPCQSGMTCPFASDMANYHTWLESGAPQFEAFPKLLPGHMSLATNPLSVYACKDEEHCPGGNPGTCGPNLDTEVVSCAHCRPSWYWTGLKCKECNMIEQSLVIFPLLPTMIAPVVISVMYWMFRDDVPKWGSWQNGVASTAFLMLNHYQVTSLANQANLDTPPRVTEYFSTVTWTDDLFLLFKPICAGYNNFEKTMVLRALGPLMGLLVVVGTYLGSHLVQIASGKRVAMQTDRTVNVYFSCVFTFFAGISSMALALFKCHANPNGFYTLVKDESIHCFESRWNSMVIVAALAVLVYIFGCGALFIYIIIIGPANFDNIGFQRRWKFLFIKYRPDVWWWAIILVSRGVIMNIGYVFFELGIQQLFWIMSIIMVYAIMVIFFQPWRHRKANLIEIYMLLALMVFLGLLTWFAHGSLREDDATRIGFEIQIVIMIVNLSPILLSAGVVYTLIRSQRDDLYVQQELQKANELRRYVEEVTKVPDDEFNLFLMSLDDWSFWHVKKAFAVIALELAGIFSAQKGLYPALYLKQKQESSSSMKAHASENNAAVAPPVEAAVRLIDECEEVGEVHDKNGIETETDAVECSLMKPRDSKDVAIDESMFEVLDENLSRPCGVRVTSAWQGSGSDVNWD